MRKIYKYILDTTDVQRIKIPKLAGVDLFKEQVLMVDAQKGIPCIWCLVDVEEEEQEVLIRIIGTGNPMPSLTQDDYLGSYMLFDGELVFHVFVEQ